MPPSDDFTFNYTGTIEAFVVPITGIYDITAYGAQGGGEMYSSGVGGAGAEVGVDITLAAGTTLKVLVGGMPAPASGFAGNGGGGSFVVEEANGVDVPVVVAGGGGGSGIAGQNGGAGQTATGTGGGGASGNGDSGGGGGGGFVNSGASSAGGDGGASFLSGGSGGDGFGGVGGFGGGGGGAVGGGGGGGFSGGAGGSGSSGGGGSGGLSYYSPSALTVTFGVTEVNDGNGEVTIDLLCFLAGTAIATPGGEVPVGALRVGDLVLTKAGRAVPLTWIGRRSVTAATKLDRDLHYPVRIRRDAVAPGIPRRDLLVTGDHAIFVDGHLIPARMLVNGGSIRAERAMTTFTYFHLELERHDLLLAQGLPAESYLDTGNRHMFADTNVVGLAQPSRSSAAEAYAARGVAPLTLAPELVEPVWRRLAARAAALGMPPVPTEGTSQHGLHLLAGERRILPIHAAGDRALFVVPPGVREAVLISGVTRPADTRPWLDDRRCLGVKVSRVRVHADGETMDVALDGPLLGGGWHGVEPAGRWTGGSGVLALRGGANVSVLELTIAGAIMERPVDREAA